MAQASGAFGRIAEEGGVVPTYQDRGDPGEPPLLELAELPVSIDPPDPTLEQVEDPLRDHQVGHKAVGVDGDWQWHEHDPTGDRDHDDQVDEVATDPEVSLQFGRRRAERVVAN